MKDLSGELRKLFSIAIVVVLLMAPLSAPPALALEADGSDVEIAPDKPSITGVAPVKLPINYDADQSANVKAAIELMKEFDWTEKAENALKWFNDQKIYADDLPAGTFGQVSPLNDHITLDRGILGPGIFDRNTRFGFSDLLHLAAIIIHEKEHAHQSFGYMFGSNMKSAPYQIFKRENPAEQDAYTQEFGFLDKVITVLVERIKSNKEAPKDKMIQMFWELSEALGLKAGGINSYYSEHPNYGPLPWTQQRANELNEFRRQVIDQRRRLEERKDVDWELFEKLAKDYKVAEAQIEAEAEEWLAGAPQRSASAEESIVIVGALESINGMVAKSIEFGPGDWFSGGKLVSDLFGIEADPIHWDPPALLTIQFSSEVVSNIDKIDVYRFEPRYGHWERLADGRSVDMDGHIISVKISSLAVFGVFEDPPEDYPVFPVGGIITDPEHDLIYIHTKEPVPPEEYLGYVDVTEVVVERTADTLSCHITVKEVPPEPLEYTALYNFMFDENNNPEDNCMEYPWCLYMDTMYRVIYDSITMEWIIERVIYDGDWIVEETNASFGMASSLPDGFSISISIPLTELLELSRILPWKVITGTFNGPSIGDLAPDEGVVYLNPLLGDTDGNGEVDIFDVVLIAMAFGSTPIDVNWNQAADLNNDSIVDIFDVVLLTQNFGKTIEDL